MREPSKDKGRLQHMLDMALLLQDQKDKYSLDTIKADKVSFFGLSKIVEIIGEAAYMITKEYKTEHSQLSWKQIEGMRHILVHGYFSISADILWDVIENDIPMLISTIEEYIKEFEK